jgi:hypothetical protein
MPFGVQEPEGISICGTPPSVKPGATLPKAETARIRGHSVNELRREKLAKSYERTKSVNILKANLSSAHSLLRGIPRLVEREKNDLQEDYAAVSRHGIHCVRAVLPVQRFGGDARDQHHRLHLEEWADLF